MTMTAEKVANIIVNYANKENKPITNLHLQKILYFVWIDYFIKNDTHLFEDNFEAWKLGPVVRSVYNKYCIYGSNDIPSIDNTISKELFVFINKYLGESASSLVNKSHKKNGAWDTVFKDGIGDKNIIPFDIIEQKCR